MEQKTFVLLLSLNKDNAKVGKELLARIKRDVDASAGPLWVDSKGIGVFISTPHPAWKVWKLAFPDTLDKEDRMALQDLLILQVGPDFYGNPNARAVAWMNSRYPKPR